jgi:hypothetical protein
MVGMLLSKAVDRGFIVVGLAFLSGKRYDLPLLRQER